MGSFNEETKYLLMYKDTADYAFMHTEISKMKMDNGMSITSGVNPDAFNGMIFAGHIHKRQETKKVIYVGSPFQMSRSDIGNQKGIYNISKPRDTGSANPNHCYKRLVQLLGAFHLQSNFS